MKRVLSNIVTKFQRDAVYDEHSTENIYMTNKFQDNESYKSSGYELIEFNDKENRQHRFLYKAPTKESDQFAMVFGGTDLDLNDKRYKNLFDKVASSGKNNQNIGIIVPIYPGYHQDKGKPSEKVIMNSADKIYEYITNKNERNSSDQLKGVEVKGSNLTITGYSLGGPIAASVAAKNIEVKNLVLISPPSSIKDVSIDVLSEDKPRLIRKLINIAAALFNEKYDIIESLKKLKTRDIQITHIVSANEDFNNIKGLDGKTHTERIKESLSGSVNYSISIIDDSQKRANAHANIINNSTALYDLKNAVRSNANINVVSNETQASQSQQKLTLRPISTPKLNIGAHRAYRDSGKSIS